MANRHSQQTSSRYSQQTGEFEELLKAILTQMAPEQMNQEPSQQVDYGQADAGAINARYLEDEYLRRQDELDSGSGILGYFGRKGREKELEEFKGQHRQGLMDALAQQRGVQAAMAEQERIGAEAERQASAFEKAALLRQAVPGMSSGEATARGFGLSGDLPEQQKPTSLMQEADALYPRGSKEWNDFVQGSRMKSGVAVYTGNQQPTDPYAPKRNELAIGRNEKYIEAGNEARKMLPSYEYGLNLLDRVETGPLTEKLNYAKKLANSLGFDVDLTGVSNYEQLAPIFGQFLFQGIQQTKGSVSNKEMEIFQKINANYNYTTEGNKSLLKYAKAKAKRDIDIAKLVNEGRQQGLPPMALSQSVDEYLNKNDLSDILSSLIQGQKPVVAGYTIEKID